MGRVSGEQEGFLTGPNPRSLTDPSGLGRDLKDHLAGLKRQWGWVRKAFWGRVELAEGTVASRHTASDFRPGQV